MSDQIEFLEAALDGLPEGIVLMDREGAVTFWNRAAVEITGYPPVKLIGRQAGEALRELVIDGAPDWAMAHGTAPEPGHGSLLQIRHRMGHQLPVMTHQIVLRNGLGEHVGTALLFHPAARLDALPHGEDTDGAAIASTQAELLERLETEFADFQQGRVPLGVLWITIDQAHELRKTHGARACEAMFEKVGRTLAHGLRPGEEAGRWGADEFLVISHERTAEMLGAHGQTLVGLARTADFRWWGDRVSLTASVGAAQAEEGDTLAVLLARAQNAMETSIHAGGNHVTNSPGRQTCSPS